MFRSLLLGLLAAAGTVNAVTVTEYSDPGCTTVLPAGSQGPQSPFDVSSGECKPFGAGSSVGYFQVTCDSVFYQMNVFGSSSTGCSGAPALTSTGTSNMCVRMSTSSWVKVNCGASPQSGNVIVQSFADSGCSVSVPVASSGTLGPTTVPNGQCSTLSVASGGIFMTATVYGPLFSLAVWGSSGANCQGAPDAMSIVGGTGVCTSMGPGGQYVMVTSTSGFWSGSGSQGTVSEYMDAGCSAMAAAGSAGPATSTFTNGACTQYQAGSNVGYYSLSGACSMYVLSVYGPSSSNCNGAPVMTDIGVTGRCSAIAYWPSGWPYYPTPRSYAMVQFNPTGQTCPNTAAKTQQTGIIAAVTVLLTAILTKLAL